jgi:hypothetical protein
LLDQRLSTIPQYH